jgi:hypothetical protein
MERARSDIAQYLRRVGCLRNEHRRRRQVESQDVASATNMPGSRDECLRLFAEGDTGSARAFRGGVARMIAIIGPAVCGLLALGTT